MAKTKKAEGPALFEDGELAAAPEPLAEQALAVWNEIAGAAGWPTARFLTEARRRAIKRAIKDYGGLVGWRANLEKASRNAFLTGKTERSEKHAKWKPDLDWFLKPSTVVKLLEDRFPADAAPVPMATSLSKKLEPTDQWARIMRSYEPGKWWPSGRGPRPEEPGCRATPSILVAWRERHGIVIEVPKAETREEKLRSAIVSYRRVGNHTRANEIEAQLAQIEGRAATMIPHASVASMGMPAKEPPRRPEPVVTDVEEIPPWEGDIPEGDEAQAEP